MHLRLPLHAFGPCQQCVHVCALSASTSVRLVRPPLVWLVQARLRVLCACLCVLRVRLCVVGESTSVSFVRVPLCGWCKRAYVVGAHASECLCVSYVCTSVCVACRWAPCACLCVSYVCTSVCVACRWAPCAWCCHFKTKGQSSGHPLQPSPPRHPALPSPRTPIMLPTIGTCLMRSRAQTCSLPPKHLLQPRRHLRAPGPQPRPSLHRRCRRRRLRQLPSCRDCRLLSRPPPRLRRLQPPKHCMEPPRSRRSASLTRPRSWGPPQAWRCQAQQSLCSLRTLTTGPRLCSSGIMCTLMVAPNSSSSSSSSSSNGQLCRRRRRSSSSSLIQFRICQSMTQPTSWRCGRKVGRGGAGEA